MVKVIDTLKESFSYQDKNSTRVAQEKRDEDTEPAGINYSFKKFSL